MRKLGRPQGTTLTDRLAVRVTADEKMKIALFCRKNKITQKRLILAAIDRFIAA
jgi:hypothetical protein